MIKLLYGNEPYVIKKQIKKACEELAIPEMNISKIDIFEEEEMSLARQYPLVDKKRVIILSLESFNNNELLKDYVSAPSETTDLYITVQNLDKRTVIYKLLKKKNMVEECNKLSPQKLEQFILKKIKENGSSISGNDDFLMLIERLNYYYQNEETNLFSIEILIKQLCFANKVITAKSINLVDETVNEKAFAIFSMIVSRNGEKTYRTILHLLETGEQTIRLLSLILRNYRLVYKYRLLNGSMETRAKSMGLSSYQIRFCAENHISQAEAENSMLIIENAINEIKNGADSMVVCKITVGKLLCISDCKV